MLRFVAVPTSLDKAQDGRGPQKNKHHKVLFQKLFLRRRDFALPSVSLILPREEFSEERKSKYPASDYCLQYGFSSFELQTKIIEEAYHKGRF